MLNPPYQRPIVWGSSLAGWLLLGILNAGSEVVDVLTGKLDAPYWEPITWELTSTLAWALLTPFIATGVHVLQDRRVRTQLAIHTVLAGTFSLLHVVSMVGLRETIYRWQGAQYDFGPWGWGVLYEGFKDVVTYTLVAGLTLGLIYYRRYRQREVAASRLEASLARARLDNLEQQIQPHFLFNTLNMISSTMHDDVALADSMITRLSDLLRLAVQSRGRQEVPLGEELEMLQAYLDIMHVRFEDRLEVDVMVPIGVRAIPVPPLILQPLVENAIKHGMTDQNRLRIQVASECNGTHLVLQVEDDGPGLDLSDKDSLAKGIGLSGTAERLEGLYGESQSLTLANSEGGGARLRIRLPMRNGGQT